MKNEKQVVENKVRRTDRLKVVLFQTTFFTACLFFLFSCIGTKELMRETPANQDMISVHAVNGNYVNHSPTDTLTPTLWNVLYQSYSFREDSSGLGTSNVVINLTLNQKSLIVLAKEGDMIIGEFELKGKIKGDYFCANRNLFLVPIPFLFFRHRERRLVLGVTSENQLIVNHGTTEFLWVIMAGGYDYRLSDRYEKTK